MTYHSGNQLIDPYVIFEKIHLAPGMHVADFGSGRTGNFVFPAASIVGSKGGVYAIDILKEALSGIAKRAGFDRFFHVHTVWADIEKPKGIAIPEKTLDVVFVINFLSAIKKHDIVLTEASRLLKDNGCILIVDWIKNTLSFAPKTEEIVDWEQIKAWGQSHNYVIENLFEVGKYHGGMVLRKT